MENFLTPGRTFLELHSHQPDSGADVVPRPYDKPPDHPPDTEYSPGYHVSGPITFSFSNAEARYFGNQIRLLVSLKSWKKNLTQLYRVLRRGTPNFEKIFVQYSSSYKIVRHTFTVFCAMERQTSKKFCTQSREPCLRLHNFFAFKDISPVFYVMDTTSGFA